MDGTEERKDTSQATEDTSSEKQETSTKTEETFTKSQRDKSVSDALAAAGRTAKSLEKREEATKKVEERMTQERREKREAEIEANREEPDKLTAVQQRHKREDEKAELAKWRTELEEREEKVKGVEGVAKNAEIREAAMKIAAKHNVDIESLVNFTDGSTEKMEELAKLLQAKGETPILKVDSSKTIGGGEMPDSAHGKMRAGWDELHKS